MQVSYNDGLANHVVPESELGTYGSGLGMLSNEHSYRDTPSHFGAWLPGRGTDRFVTAYDGLGSRG